MTSSLEEQFHKAMIDIYYKAKADASYTASIFLDMVVRDGGIATAKTLINSPKPSSGYTALYERKHLELTVEAVVIEDARWHPLFTAEELAKARKRLSDYRYAPRPT